jgi:diaminopimelate epimerase
MHFEKWHGLGNDYLIVERDELGWPMTPERAARLSDRHFGVGGDGVLEVDHELGRPRMTVWNPDGSNAESCGNGIRMVARHLERRGQLPADRVIETGAGAVTAEPLEDGRVRVRMGRAVFPASEAREHLGVNGGDVEFAEISMGNPHAVIEHADPAAVVGELGPEIEVAERFPDRTNVEFIRSEGPSEITMRVWERGVGETLACGTGACAAAVAAVRLGGAQSPVTVHLAGGDLEIAVDDDLEVTMTGPAVHVYDGQLTEELAHGTGER